MADYNLVRAGPARFGAINIFGFCPHLEGSLAGEGMGHANRVSAVNERTPARFIPISPVKLEGYLLSFRVGSGGGKTV